MTDNSLDTIAFERRERIAWRARHPDIKFTPSNAELLEMAGDDPHRRACMLDCFGVVGPPLRVGERIVVQEFEA